MMRYVAVILGFSLALSALVVLPPLSDWRLPGMGATDDLAIDVTRNADMAAAGDDDEANPFVMTDGTTLEATTDNLLQAMGVIPEVAGTSLSPFEALVLDLLQQGMSDAEIDAAVNDAARHGDMTVPAELVAADGRVDTIRLLAAVETGAREMMSD
jgi:hypothetical protein